MSKMTRTNIVIDEELIRRVMDLFNLPSKREAVDFSLRRTAGVEDPWKAAAELEGIWADRKPEEFRDTDGDPD